MKPVLYCSGVHKAYYGVGVLHGVDLTVHAGEIVGLVGANGSGKTTFVDIIGGQHAADSGEVLLDGVPFAGSPSQRARRGLARTFQRPLIATDLTFRENVATGLAARELTSVPKMLAAALSGIWAGRLMAHEEIGQLCAQLALADIDRSSAEATFGELRLLEVARALIQQPRLLILDEPFSGVGDAGISAVTDALRLARTRGCAVLVIDHNIDLLTELVDRMALLFEGTVVVDADVTTCISSDLFRRNYIGVV